MHKKQQDRKKRKNFTPELFERYLRRNEGTTDYATIPSVTLAGDFSGSFEFSTSAAASATTLFGSELLFKISISATGKVSLLVGNGSSWIAVITTSLSYNDGKLYGGFFSKVGNLYTLTINGVVLTVSAAGAVTPSISYLYVHAVGGGNFSGILANLKIWDNGTLIRDYPLDDNSDILRNRAAVLGGELYGSTDALTQATGGVVSLDTGLTASAEINYLITINYSDVIGSTSLRTGSGGDQVLGPVISGTGSVTFNLMSLSSTNFEYVGRFGGVTSGVVTTSIRQADGYGTVINGNASDWGLFQQQATGEWLGQELVVNGGFDTDADWIKTGGSSISGGLGIIDGSGGSSLLYQGILTNGLSYASVIDVASDDDNINNEVIDNSGVILHEVNGVGVQTFTFTHANISPNYLFKANGGAFSVNSGSVKEVLNVA